MKQQSSATAFVLGLADGGLAAVRSLARRGIPVIGVDFDSAVSGVRSRYCQAMIWPDPVRDPDGLVEHLVRTGKRLSQPGVLIPTSDAYALFISRFRSTLREAFVFTLPAEGILESIVDKRLFHHLVRRHNLPAPQTFFPETLADVARIKDEVEYPCVLKPYHSHLWQRHVDNKGIKVNNRDHLLDEWQKISGWRAPMIVQSVVPGPTSALVETSLYRNSRGEFSGVFTSRKLRQMPVEFGTGTLVESWSNVVTEALAKEFCTAVDYRGMANIEFKWDARCDSFKLIEVNPRMWLQNGLADTCGINFPLLQYSDLVGKPVVVSPEYPQGARWLDVAADCEAFSQLFQQGEITPLEWVRSLRGTRCLAAFAMDDPLPAVHSSEYGLKPLRLPLYLLRHRVGRDRV